MSTTPPLAAQTASPSPQGTYAQWVREAVAHARSADHPVISLFESSIPEPRELLRLAIRDTVEPVFAPHYVSAFGEGNPLVRAHLAQAYDVAIDQVLCTTGATGSLSLIYRALLSPGDHVLVETPGFDLFGELAHVQGIAVDSFTRHGDGFVIDVDEVAAAMRPETRMIVVSDLHNPSGMGIGTQTLAALAALAEAYGALLVVDEVYGDYAPRAHRPGPACALSPAVISLSSLTKIFGLGVLRCGWIVGAPEIMARLIDFSGRVEFGVSTLSHAVAAQVLARADEFTAHWQGHVARARPRFEAWYTRMVAQGLMAGALPEAGCICFPQLVGIADTRAFCEDLLAQSGVIVAPGAFFRRPGHVRIGFCLPDAELDAGLSALEAALRRYHRAATAA